MITCSTCGTLWCMCTGAIRCPECGTRRTPNANSSTKITNLPFIQAAQDTAQRPEAPSAAAT